MFTSWSCSCGNVLRFGEHLAGRQVRCQRCQATVSIPALGDLLQTPPPAPVAPQAPARAPSAQSRKFVFAGLTVSIVGVLAAAGWSDILQPAPTRTTPLKPAAKAEASDANEFTAEDGIFLVTTLGKELGRRGLQSFGLDTSAAKLAQLMNHGETPVPDLLSMIGTVAADATLRDGAGQPVRLDDLLGDRPLVVEFGGWHCPLSRSQSKGMDELAAKYQGTVDFALVHDLSVGPFAQKARSAGAAQRMTDQRQLGASLSNAATRLVLWDEPGPTNLQRRYLPMPNPTVVFGCDRRVALLMPWTNSATLDQFLMRFVAQGGTFNRELASQVRPMPPHPLEMMRAMQEIQSMMQEMEHAAPSMEFPGNLTPLLPTQK